MPKFRKNLHWYFLAALAFATGLIWIAVFEIEDSAGKLRWSVLDVGQGDAIFLQAGNGNEVLIDGGPDASVLSKLSAAMPFWDRSIDLVILTHPHADHLDGLVEVLKRYTIGVVLESGVNHSIPEYGEWHTLLREKGIRVVLAKAGQRVRLSDTVSLEVLAPLVGYEGRSPKDVHEAMVVLKLVHGTGDVLLMGDAERPLERELLASGANLDVDILKVGHHGSKTSTSEEFLRATTPQVAIISVGRKNRYGHPTQEVLDRLAREGIRVLRTDRDGTIVFRSDGNGFVRH